MGSEGYGEEMTQAIGELEGQQSGDETQNSGLPVEGQQGADEQGGDGAAQPQQSPQQGGQQQVWDAKEYTLKYRDKEIIPRDKKHLIDLAQQGYHLSSRMAELKEMEKSLNSQKGKFDQYRQLEEAFAKNPAFRQKILEWYNSSLNGGAGAGQQPGEQPSAGAIPKEVADALADLRERVGRYDEERATHEQERADQELRGEIDKLKERYPRDDWDRLSSSGKTLVQEICEHAFNNGGIKLETAYRDLMWDSNSKNSEANGRKAAADAAAAAKKAGVVSGGRSKGAAAPQETNTKGMSYDQIADHVRKEYNLTQ